MKHRYSVEQLEQMSANPWLTDREREVFELYYRRGWAIEDIAAEMYLSRNTINNTLYSLRHKAPPAS